MFVSTCTTIFWQACRNYAWKSTEDLLRSKSENDSIATFSKKNFPSFPSFKNWKTCSSGHAENSCDNPAENFLSNFKKNLLEIGKRRKNDQLSKKLIYSSNCSSEHGQWKFVKPAVTLLARIRKTIAKTRRYEYTFFEQNWFFSIKYDSLATENAILTTLAKFPSKNPQFCRSESENYEKILWIFGNEKHFRQNVPMYMWNAVVTTLPKISRQNSENFLLEFRKWWKADKISWKPTCKIVHLNMHNKILTSLP